MSRWSTERVLALAPDGASVAAGRKLAVARGWPALGCDARAVWGSAQGSGKTPYQVAVELEGPAYKCSCPSRKIPCKHVLGLLLLWSAGEVQAGAPPAYAEEWLASRAERAVKAEVRSAERSTAQADPAARAKRQAQREERISAGVEELDRWTRDLVRQGLAAARSRPMRFWDDAAARLVDAQAPGLGGRVRALGSTAHSGAPDWPARLLSQLARVHLAVSAWPRSDALPDGLRASLRDVLGWPLPGEEVRRTGERIDDAWLVVGVRVLEQERLRVRRTWLRGERSDRHALIVQFTPPGGAFDGDYSAGAVLDGTLAFFPAAAPLRALPLGELEQRPSRAPGAAEAAEAAGASGAPGASGAAGASAAAGAAGAPEAAGATGAAGALGSGTIADALAEWARAFAADPWLERWPVALSAATPVRHDGRWWLRDGDGTLAPLAARGDHWRLIALAGGAPLQVSAEWDGAAMHPLAAVTDDARTVALT